MQDLITQPHSSNHPEILEYLRVLQRRKWTVALCLAAVMILAVLLNELSTPVFQAEATIIYEEPKDTMFALDVGQLLINKSALINLTEQLKSRTLATEVAQALPEWVVATFEFPQPLPANFSREKFIVEELQENLVVVPVSGSDILKIYLDANDPGAAKIIANTYVERIIGWGLRKKREEISGVRDFIEQQLAVFQDKLSAAEESLRVFKEKNRLISLSETSVEILKRLTEVSADFNKAKTERAALEQRQNYIDRKKQAMVPSFAAASGPRVEQLKQHLLDLEIQYATKRLNALSEQEPEIVALKQNLSRTKQELTGELLKAMQESNLIDPLAQKRNLLKESIGLEVELTTYKAREQGLKKIIDAYDKELLTLPKQELMLARFMRAREVDNKIYSMLLEKREEVRITEAGKIGDVHVIDAAQEPLRPIKPKKTRNLVLGFILGLVIGVGFAFFLQSLETSLKSSEDVEQYVQLPVLAAIPTIGTNGRLNFEKRNGHAKAAYSAKLLSQMRGSSQVSEAYRALQINFAFANADRIYKSVLVTSPGPGEGKTLTAANMAQAFARSGLKTLLIDCDLRRPMIHTILSLSKEPGLTNLLIDKVSVDDAIHKLENENLLVLPSGTLPPNPSELLDSQKMRELLAAFRRDHDVIILDSPPLLPVTDSIVLSAEVDGVLLVIKSGSTNREMALRAKHALRNSRTKIIGAILNNIDLKSVYGYYQAYYDYYADHEKSAKPRGGIKGWIRTLSPANGKAPVLE